MKWPRWKRFFISETNLCPLARSRSSDCSDTPPRPGALIRTYKEHRSPSNARMRNHTISMRRLAASMRRLAAPAAVRARQADGKPRRKYGQRRRGPPSISQRASSHGADVTDLNDQPKRPQRIRGPSRQFLSTRSPWPSRFAFACRRSMCFRWIFTDTLLVFHARTQRADHNTHRE
jgi:hypothetical protein